MVSVDIAAWDAPIGGFEADAKNMASDLSRSDLAKKIWSLIHAHIPWKLAYGAKAPTPRWCHIDDDIKDRSPSDQSFLNAGRIDVSAALYSVPQKGDWRDRPGTIAPEPDYQKKAKSDPTLWQPEDGGYAVHWGKLVFAGTYLKTLSRAPTLETACEAGLQAANAIARHYAATHSGKGPKLVDPPQRTSEWTFGDGSWEQKPRSAEPDGDSKPCEIWDPEENELPELMKLRKYDEECFKRELPHPWDLLGLELLPSLTSWLPASHRSLDPRLGWSNAGSDHQLQWTGEAYFRLVRAFREALEKKYSGTNEDSNSAPAGEE
jgi:hypothetical protein